MRLQNTEKKEQIDEEVVLIWPFLGKERIWIKTGDFAKLQDESAYLNDVIIDFYLKWVTKSYDILPTKWTNHEIYP